MIMQQNSRLNVTRLEHESKIEVLEKATAKLQEKKKLTSTEKWCITRVLTTPSIQIHLNIS